MEHLFEKYDDLKVGYRRFMSSCPPVVRGVIAVILFPWGVIGIGIWAVARLLASN